MDIWLIFLLCLCISILLASIFSHFKSSTTNLPPGPPSIPIITNFLWLRRSSLQIESLLRRYAAKYGPIFTIHIGNRPAIFISDRSIAHTALLHNATLFAYRPTPTPIGKIISCNQHNINTANYGPLWRLLRRNLTSQILHPSRVKSFDRARKWALDILLTRLLPHSESGSTVRVVDHLQYAMFCLLGLMCYGDKLDESQIREIENVHRTLLLSFGRFNILNIWPKLTKIIFRKYWNEFLQLKENEEKVIIPLIQANRKAKNHISNKANGVETEEKSTLSYVDTLLDLDLPDENRKLTDREILSLCAEFMNGGTDTTPTALQWIMANLVKYPEIQNMVYTEIKGVMRNGSVEEEVKEEDLVKLPYLKCVVLEGLRRHPPGHFVVPHAVKENTRLGDYVIPKNGMVCFMVAEMGWDRKVWEDPMVFKPERFFKEEEGETRFDITGITEIKMMPFGAGRRICPGLDLAILHLEYFIANLIWRFEWKAVDGDGVDLSEKVEFTVVMEKPLKANIILR